jgi:hypothetical protein
MKVRIYKERISLKTKRKKTKNKLYLAIVANLIWQRTVFRPTEIKDFLKSFFVNVLQFSLYIHFKSLSLPMTDFAQNQFIETKLTYLYENCVFYTIEKIL